MDNKKKVRNDIILAAVLLLSALAVFMVFRLTMRPGAYVLAAYDGEEIGRYSLFEDITVKLSPEDDDSYNVLVIKDGEAYIEEASCPDGICSEHRAVKYSGQSIVCLPNKIVVTVIGEGNAPDVDIVS